MDWRYKSVLINDKTFRNDVTALNLFLDDKYLVLWVSISLNRLFSSPSDMTPSAKKDTKLSQLTAPTSAK